MFCSKCGKEIDNNSIFCCFCGANQNKVQIKVNEENINEKIYVNNDAEKINESDVEVINSNEINNFDINRNKLHKKDECPNCGSEYIQKFSLVYLNGIGKIDGTNVGAGTGGIYGGFINGKSQTALSELTAPPRKKWVFRRYLFLQMLMGLFTYSSISVNSKGLLLLKILVLFSLSLLVPIFYAIRGYIFNKKLYQRLYYLWDKKYLCLKCSKCFYLDGENENLFSEEKMINAEVENWKKNGKKLLFVTIFLIVLNFILVSVR